jgi:hypothetical protein
MSINPIATDDAVKDLRQVDMHDKKAVLAAIAK